MTAPAIDSLFTALADTTRRKVIERLSRAPASVTDLAKGFDMALPSFLQHLRLLERAGLVSSQKTGRIRTYSLQAQNLKLAENWLAGQRLHWESRLDQLDDYLLKLKKERSKQ